MLYLYCDAILHEYENVSFEKSFTALFEGVSIVHRIQYLTKPKPYVQNQSCIIGNDFENGGLKKKVYRFFHSFNRPE